MSDEEIKVMKWRIQFAVWTLSHSVLPDEEGKLFLLSSARTGLVVFVLKHCTDFVQQIALAYFRK